MMAAPPTLEEGRILAARSVLHSTLSSAGVPDRRDVRAYMQTRHLSQGVAGAEKIDCTLQPAEHRLACHGLNSALGLYDQVSLASTQSDGAVALQWGRDRHAVVELRSDGARAPMIIDTGSMATILPQRLAGAVKKNLRETKVSNLGRVATLMMVRTATLTLGHHELHNWVAATSDMGFVNEGVLGLDVLYALGGVTINAESRLAQFGECADTATTPVRFLDGALVAPVLIDGQSHQALIDTGSVRSFVLAERPVGGLLKVRSDFGDASLRGEMRPSHVAIGGFARTAKIAHTSEAGRFYPGTSAIIGLDVLLAGRAFGACFEPSRIWIE